MQCAHVGTDSNLKLILISLLWPSGTKSFPSHFLSNGTGSIRSSRLLSRRVMYLFVMISNMIRVICKE